MEVGCHWNIVNRYSRQKDETNFIYKQYNFYMTSFMSLFIQNLRCYYYQFSLKFNSYSYFSTLFSPSFHAPPC